MAFKHRPGRDRRKAALSAVLKSIGLYSGATVLGSGDLALILDPASIATRAGVAIRLDEEHAEIARRRRQRAERFSISARAGRPTPHRCASWRSAPHREDPHIAHRICRPSAGSQFPGATAAGRGFIRAAGLRKRQSRRANHRRRLPRRPPPRRHRRQPRPRRRRPERSAI